MICKVCGKSLTDEEYDCPARLHQVTTKKFKSSLTGGPRFFRNNDEYTRPLKHPRTYNYSEDK